MGDFYRRFVTSAGELQNFCNIEGPDCDADYFVDGPYALATRSLIRYLLDGSEEFSGSLPSESGTISLSWKILTESSVTFHVAQPNSESIYGLLLAGADRLTEIKSLMSHLDLLPSTFLEPVANQVLNVFDTLPSRPIGIYVTSAVDDNTAADVRRVAAAFSSAFFRYRGVC